MAIFVGVLIGARITLAGSIASLAGLMIVKHSGATGVTNSTVTSGINSHEAIFDMSGQGSSTIWFLELIAVVFLLVTCSCGGVHCGKWFQHFHGAHKAQRNHKDRERWAQIEEHFLSKFEGMAGNGNPAIEMLPVDTDRDTRAGEEEDSTIAIREESSSLTLGPMISGCDQTTQVYTCGRGMKQPCLASVMKEI